jgi:hypothetical protein
MPLCVPRPPNYGGKETARDFVRDDPWFYVAGPANSRLTKRSGSRTNSEAPHSGEMCF